MGPTAIKNKIRRFLGSAEGATAVEYAVMLALIMIGIIATVSSVGGGSGDLWQRNSQELQSVMSSSS